MRLVAYGLLVALLASTPTGLGADQPDCGGSGDASDAQAHARRLAAAQFLCGGRGAPGDVDWYVVAFTDGDSLQIEFPDAWADLIVLELYDPDGELVASSETGALTGIALGQHGDWHIRILHSTYLSGSSYPYSLTYWTRELTGEGDVEVGVTNALPGRGLAPLTGPGGTFDGFDGDWVALPEATHGGESIFLAEAADRVSYYDAQGREIDGPHVQHDDCNLGCRVPAGATWMILSGGDGYAYAYHY